MVITLSVVVSNIQCLSGLNGRSGVIFQVLKDYLDLYYLDLIFFIRFQTRIVKGNFRHLTSSRT